MPSKRIIHITLFVLFSNLCYGQKKFKVEERVSDSGKHIYDLVDVQGKLLRQLDRAKYYVSMSDGHYGYFAIFGKNGKLGWTAIDGYEKELFQVYNTSSGEPTPDELVENKIRIVDGKNRIGFANNKGEIIIKPQFEIATSFYKGKAIIGQLCKEEPWDKHAKESDCHHYSMVCMKHGYINEKGAVLKIGSHSFEQIAKEINWKAPND